MLCRTFSATCVGLKVIPITIEVSISQGVGIYLVGLPDSAVRESLLRVTTALQRYEFHIPGKKTVINMAPADLKKEGSGYDVAIAVGILAASGQIGIFDAREYLILGELSLDGMLRPIQGALPIAMKGAEMGFKYCIFPSESAKETSEVDDITVFGADNLIDIINILNGDNYTHQMIIRSVDNLPNDDMVNDEIRADFADVMGQEFAKRGMEIAASGNHNLIMMGPPGAGKSFMAKCLASILPKMSKKEAVETSAIYSVAGKSVGKRGLIWERPFRCPNNSASIVSLVGGGQNAMPGEISLAHNGVLYLDEMSQYASSVLDALRQPLEDRTISISRARYKVTYPASFMLVGSTNPCPCGYAGELNGKCTCTPGMIMRYMSKISGPLLDRIDLHINVKPVSGTALISDHKSESSREISKRVEAARLIQLERFKDDNIYTNSQMNALQLQKYCQLRREDKRFLEQVIDKFSLSARAYSRILKISRTIADLENTADISVKHISEAVQYRFQDYLP